MALAPRNGPIHNYRVVANDRVKQALQILGSQAVFVLLEDQGLHCHVVSRQRFLAYDEIGGRPRQESRS